MSWPTVCTPSPVGLLVGTERCRLDPSLSSQQSPSAYRSRVRTEPTTATVPQYAAVLWNRLESMFEAMTDCCVRVRCRDESLSIIGLFFGV
jgi:hypothetical protein